MPDPIKLEFSGQFPGEGIVEELIKFLNSGRANMSQQNRDDWDHLGYVMAKGWHNWWISKGWPGENVP